MRVEFAAAMMKYYDAHPNMVFVTGDLGYMALEKVEEKFGEQFINAGVAEQNMVTISASLAYEGFIPFVYSISPFVTLRPYEQIRNDVCLHNLPVKLVGNGGGYGYGIMGGTHHNLEDIGALRMLPNMRVYVPFTANDVEQAVKQMIADPHPNYLRLNVGAKISYDVAPFAQWRKIKSGDKGVIIGTGPVLENVFTTIPAEVIEGLEIWVLSIFPVTDIPDELLNRINQVETVITIEEHGGQGGMHETLGSLLLSKISTVIDYHALYAKGYPSGKYGDQKWHQAENDLGGDGLKNKILRWLKHFD